MERTPGTVIYIAGYGRSGSTLLDLVLGNHTEVRGGGELMYLLDEFRHPERRCACQQPYATCEFWAPIVREFAAADDALRAQLLHVDQRRGFVRKWFSLRRGGGAEHDAYRGFQRALFTAMTRGGARFVVDSSKSARDAAFRPVALRRVAGLDVRVLHLVRSPFRVMRSVLKQSNWQAEGYRRAPRLRVLHALPGWVLANVLAWLAGFAVGRRNYLRVGYQELVDRPDAVLRRIGAFLRIDTSRLEKMAREGAAFRSGHQAGGNRLRMKPEVVIARQRAGVGKEDEEKVGDDLQLKARP
ncbi:MAG: sulfotransferase [Planctomycetota bacterium]